MRVIDLNNNTGFEQKLYPDNQPHIIVTGVEPGEPVKVIVSLTSSLKVVHLLQVTNALEHLDARKEVLIIPYLMAARFDRIMQHGDSFDLEVISDLINQCNFKKVILFDVHSDVAIRLIKNSVSISNRELVERYSMPNAIVICPDAGASRKVKNYLDWNENLEEIIYCEKKRNLSDGKLSLEVIEPEKCENRNCVIIDDICDGGATFLAIAEQIRTSHLTLIVTHGIFSKGFSSLEKAFDKIIVSNSYNQNYNAKKVETIQLDFKKF